MSVPSTLEENEIIARVSGEVVFESAESALENLVEIKEIGFHDTFSNRNTQLQTDEDEGLSITFYHDERPNSLSLRTDSDNTLRVTLYLSGDDVGRFEGIVNSLVSHASPLSVNDLNLWKVYSHPFRSLSLPINHDSEFNVTGIRLIHDGTDFIIQEHEDDSVVLQLQRDIDVEIDESLSTDFVDAEIESADDLISRLA